MPETLFHGQQDRVVARNLTPIQERKLGYQFYPHFHPYVSELVKRLTEKSVAGLQAADTDYRKMADGTPEMLPAPSPVPPGYKPKPRPVLYEELFTNTRYIPSDLVQTPYPVKDLDFNSSGAYAAYNWELFFHVPFAIAVHLSKNQRFEEAQQWFHYIFDPTDDSDGPTPERFWKVKPFQVTDIKMLEAILVNLSSGADPALQKETINSIGAWKDAPFRPHAIARYRQSAYMLKTLTAYFDNLVAWGDALFRQDTGESINEATQLYVLAANILGPRPQAVPKKGSVRSQTYASLRADLDELGNALRDLEADIPFDITPYPTQASGTSQLSTLDSIGKALYFSVPRNDQLLGYWDTIADRLFKIRNSLDLQGVFRQLPLFEPPIDPALLAKASAAGLDVGAILSGINQPLPLVRFQLLVQKAAEICQEVKSLGSNLLSTIEKQDNEALAVLRARHELVILGLAETVKYGQLQEAIKNREGLEKSLNNALQRYTYYEQVLGNQAQIKLPPLDALDRNSLEKMKLEAQEPVMGVNHTFNVDLAPQNVGQEQQTGGKKLNRRESEEMAKLAGARFVQERIETYEMIGAILAPLPDSSMSFAPWGIGFGITGVGGTFLSKGMSALASVGRGFATKLTYEAGNAGKIGSYDRRELDWQLQSNLAAGEITQTLKQLRAAQIREAVAEREWKNHQQQILHAEDIEHFLAGEKNGSGHKKTSTQAFYAWMKCEVKGLYGQCFQFAFDIAKKAERALQHELGKPDLSFVQFGYLAGKEGLLAGEKLYLDIKRMEMAYHELNVREYELTKHVSLLQVDPTALMQLRTAGKCSVYLPEELFDMDCPGHYFRRIKTVAVTIPCIVGPNTSVNCTLTLTKSTIRKVAQLRGAASYVREDGDDDRFSDHFGAVESIVTSTAQNDSGLFDTNLHDERRLPCEGSGVVSEWQLRLPATGAGDARQFDYDTISDVILHIRYTAREGGQLLRNAALASLNARIDDAQAAGSERLFSVRHEFPTAWASFKNQQVSPGVFAKLTLDLKPEHYPFWSQGRLLAVRQADLFAETTKTGIKVSRQSDGTQQDTLGVSFGNLKGCKLTHPPATPTEKFSLYFTDKSMDDIFLKVAWGK